MSNDLLKEVSEKLAEIFEGMGHAIDVDKTYLTSVVVNEQGKQVVDYSESLSWAIMEKVQANELPDFKEDFAGVFFKQWTFDPAYRVASVDVIDVNNSGRFIVRSYRDEKRASKSTVSV
ncbi:hypothetical protein [Pseudomonas sp. MAG733B]|uniref:hypothetical protein n=1 Tax=Pseudomonas sp. MAG733B TaxID=3122079 RepID=UPI0030D31753